MLVKIIRGAMDKDYNRLPMYQYDQPFLLMHKGEHYSLVKLGDYEYQIANEYVVPIKPKECTTNY